MREIKFRAWDSKKGMSKPFGLNGFPAWGDGETKSFWSSMCKMMQYTGLKDCEGKEIYEGDVLGHAGGYNWEVYFKQEICAFKYKAFTKYGKWLDYPLSDFNMQMNTRKKGMIVIGNIHDNPELLEVEK